MTGFGDVAGELRNRCSWTGGKPASHYLASPSWEGDVTVSRPSGEKCWQHQVKARAHGRFLVRGPALPLAPSLHPQCRPVCIRQAGIGNVAPAPSPAPSSASVSLSSASVVCPPHYLLSHPSAMLTRLGLGLCHHQYLLVSAPRAPFQSPSLASQWFHIKQARSYGHKEMGANPDAFPSQHGPAGQQTDDPEHWQAAVMPSVQKASSPRKHISSIILRQH